MYNVYLSSEDHCWVVESFSNYTDAENFCNAHDWYSVDEGGNTLEMFIINDYDEDVYTEADEWCDCHEQHGDIHSSVSVDWKSPEFD